MNLTKKQYLDICTEKVAHYKQGIEEKTGIDLGDLKVSSTFALPAHRVRSHLMEFYFLNEKRNVLFDACAISLVPFVYGASLVSAIRPDYMAFYAALVGVDPTIFFNTRLRNTLSLENSDTIDSLDVPLVHELSHRLWHAILNDASISGDTRFNRRFPFLSEGYADYCATTYFSELYPSDLKVQPFHFLDDPETMPGIKRIESFVKAHGEGILLEIPKRWDELDSSMPYSVD